MNIAEKFNQGLSKHTYQRINSQYKTDFFLGYNDDGNMSIALIEAGRYERVHSSKYIDVNLRKRDDGKIVLTFDLLDKSYSSLFMIFCQDLIAVCEKSGCEMAISNAITRWKYWKELFGRRRSHLLDKNEIKGLMGELIQLRDFFIPWLGSKVAVESWMGPLLGHKDFEIYNEWYEIKALSENAIQVNISSLEQLDSDIPGHLMLVRLEESSSVSTRAFNLNQIVLQIMSVIKDPEDLETFRNKLDTVGYVANPEYDSVNYLYKGTQKYRVEGDFPRLTRKEMGPSIGNVKYTILIDGIAAFLED